MVLLGMTLYLAQSHLLEAVMAVVDLILPPQNLEEMAGLAVVVAVVVQLQTLAAQEIPHQQAQHKVVMVVVGFKDRLIMVLAAAAVHLPLAQQAPLLQAAMAALELHLLF
jgi:hypothetical protein